MKNNNETVGRLNSGPKLAVPLKEAAPMIGLSHSQVSDLVRSGVIHAIRILRPGTRRGLWLIPMAEIERLLTQGK